MLDAPRDVVHDEIFNVGLVLVELPDPPDRRDRRRARARVRAAVRRLERRQAQLPGRLREDPVAPAGVRVRSGTSSGVWPSCSTCSPASGSTSSVSLARAHAHRADPPPARHRSRSTTTSSGPTGPHDADGGRASRRVGRAAAGDLHEVLSLGSTPIANALVDPGTRAGRRSRRSRSAIVFCAACALVQLGYALPAERDLRRGVPVLLVVLRRARARTPRPTSSSSSRRAASARRRSSSRSRATTATCCATSSPPGSRALGIDPSPGPAAAAEEIGVPTIVGLLRRRPGPGDPRRARSGRRHRRQQRDGPRARPQRLRRRVRRRCWPTTAWSPSRTRTCATSSSTSSSTRSTTSTTATSRARRSTR